MPGRPEWRVAREALIGAAVLLHVAALVLYNLPWSPLVAALAPWYTTYVRATGQHQAWAMYQTPYHYDPRFRLEARLADGRTIEPLRPPETWSFRTLYFLEGSFFDGSSDLLDRYLRKLHDEMAPTPVSLTLSLWRTDVPVPGVAAFPVELRQARKIGEKKRTW